MKATQQRIFSGATAALVIIALGIGSALGAKGDKPAKPGDDGGKTSLRFARISFNSNLDPEVGPIDGVRCDGVPACPDPDGLTWDYWDWRDEPVASACEGGCTADVSGGGRLHFFTVNLQGLKDPLPTSRWLVLDFSMLPDGSPSGSNPDIDSLYQGRTCDPQYDPTAGIDNVKAVLSLENMFSPNATQQELVLSIRECYHPKDPEICWAPPVGWNLVWLDPLNIIQDPSDPDVRILTTDGTSAVAELRLDDDLKARTPPIIVGQYLMPIHWTMRLVAAP